MDERIRITMVAPKREKCGVADYTQYLLRELRNLADVVNETDAEDFTPEMNAVDIVHIQHQYFLFGGVAPWKNWFGRFYDKVTVPIVLTAHEFVSPNGNMLRRRLIGLTNKRQFFVPRIKRILVHTEMDLSRMEMAGIPGDRIRVIRHGVPPGLHLPSREEARKSLDLDKRFVATIFGFISQRKGYRIAVEALKRLPGDVVLLIAGGQHPDDRTDFVQNLKSQSAFAGDRIRFTGYLSDRQVAEVMSATDVVLAPFLESSGSGSIAMALACGKPIIASPIEPHLEMDRLAPGVLVFPSPVDPSGFGEAIMSLRQNSDLMKSQTQKSLDYASSHSYRRMAEEIVNVYAQVIAERRA